MKQMPAVEKYMTPMPHTINKSMPLKTAIGIMREHRIRHLPVQEGGTLVGVISDRDLKLATGLPGARDFKVEDIMTPDPYVVAPDARLDGVASKMAEHKFGCAIVVERSKVVGVFTTVDAMKALYETLNQHFRAI